MPDSSVTEALARAAALCAEHHVDLDAFMHGAYSAYVDARPGMREHLEELKLRAHLDELRSRGRLASA